MFNLISDFTLKKKTVDSEKIPMKMLKWIFEKNQPQSQKKNEKILFIILIIFFRWKLKLKKIFQQ